MIDFRDLTPTYEIPSRVQAVEDLLRLGCSQSLIERVFPESPRGRYFLARPEDWFWQDADRLADTDGWTAELYRIAGGCFARLPLAEQCALLGLPIVTIRAPRVKVSRRSWVGRDGQLGTPEEIALSCLLGEDEIGSAVEGRFLEILTYVVMKEADRKRGRAYGLDWRDPRLAPEPERVEALKEALEQVLADPAKLYSKAHPAPEIVFRQRAIDKMTFLQMLERYEPVILRQMLHLHFRHRAAVGGHFDLTILNGKPRFYEVKTTDRLRGSQAMWVRNVARPLSLHVSVVSLLPTDLSHESAST